MRLTPLALALLSLACKRQPTTAAPRPSPLAETSTAWAAVRAGQAEGQPMSKDVALRAFASMFGPLPGVTRVAPDRSTPLCAHDVVFALDRHWRDLTPEQRQTIRRRLQLDADRPAGPAIGAQLVRSWDEESVRQRNVQAMVTRASAAVATLTGRTLRDTVRARFLERENCVDGCPTPILSMPMDYTAGQSDLGDLAPLPFQSLSGAGYCLIRIGLVFDELSEAQQFGYLAHEVFHCYQFDSFHGTKGAWEALADNASWRVEGTAAWVGEKLSGGTHARLAEGWWNVYLRGNAGSHFKLIRIDGIDRSNYPALGFFASLDARIQGGDSMGRRVLDLHVAPDDETAFSRAIANPTPLLIDMASSAMRRPEWGPSWTMDYPGITAARRGTRVEPALAATGSTNQPLEPGYQVNWEVPFASTAEVLVFETSGAGRGRLGNDEITWNGPETFAWCLRPEGCTCPDGRIAPGPPLRRGVRGAPLLIAATGAAINSQPLRVQTHPLGLSCDPPPPPPPPPIVDGPPDACLHGVWHIDKEHERVEMTRVLPPTLRLNGIAGDVVLDFNRARGVATGDYRRYCFDITAQGATPVTTRVVANGTTSGRFRATGANLRVEGATSDVGITARVRVMGMEMNVPVPLDRSLFLSAVPTNTPYRCTPDTFEFDVNTGAGTRVVRYHR